MEAERLEPSCETVILFRDGRINLKLANTALVILSVDELGRRGFRLVINDEVSALVFNEVTDDAGEIGAALIYPRQCTVIGRDMANGLGRPDTVSRKHAARKGLRNGRGVIIADLGSANGTYIE